jgi:23S rRNA pseudouridine2605 synthase
MPFKNKRNSRDDKSENSKRTSKPSSGSGPKSSSYKSGRQESTSTSKKKIVSEEPRKSFKSNSKSSDDKTSSSFSSEKRSPKSFGRSDERRSASDRFEKKPFGDRPKSGDRKAFSDRSQTEKRPYSDRAGSTKKSFAEKPQGDGKTFSGSKDTDRKPFQPRENKFADKKTPIKRFNDKPFKSRQPSEPSAFDRPKYRSDDRKWSSEEHLGNKRSKKPAVAKDDGLIRLNRFIANAGICSRRKADELIAAGVVSVNGVPVTELGFKVDPAKDLIRYNGENLKREKMVYVLLNKPKDYITTTDDPQERKTVMSLVEKASRERIYPVGRLDRNTTGLLLMTNDGDLAEKLSHPRNNITKLYQVELNKSLSQGDLNKIQFGIELEDGLIKPDQVSYVAGGSKKEVGIQIHSGKNRVVRRIFESLGYEVVKLDRVVYSQLTKKDLPRGRWRYLEEREIIQLKHLIK